MVSFIGGGNRSTRRKQPTCCNSLTNLIKIMIQRVHLARVGFDLKTLMVIDTDSIGVNPTNKRSWPWRPHLCVDINAWFYLRMYRICLHHQFNSKTSVLKFTSSSNWYRCWLLHHQLSSKDLSVYFSSPDQQKIGRCWSLNHQFSSKDIVFDFCNTSSAVKTSVLNCASPVKQ